MTLSAASTHLLNTSRDGDLNTFPGQPVPMSENSFGDETLPHIQSCCVNFGPFLLVLSLVLQGKRDQYPPWLRLNSCICGDFRYVTAWLTTFILVYMLDVNPGRVKLLSPCAVAVSAGDRTCGVLIHRLVSVFSSWGLHSFCVQPVFSHGLCKEGSGSPAPWHFPKSTTMGTSSQSSGDSCAWTWQASQLACSLQGGIYKHSPGTGVSHYKQISKFCWSQLQKGHGSIKRQPFNFYKEKPPNHQKITFSISLLNKLIWQVTLFLSLWSCVCTLELQHFIVLTLFLLNDIFNVEVWFLCIISFSVSLKGAPVILLSLKEEENYIEFGVLRENILKMLLLKKKKFGSFLCEVIGFYEVLCDNL